MNKAILPKQKEARSKAVSPSISDRTFVDPLLVGQSKKRLSQTPHARLAPSPFPNNPHQEKLHVYRVVVGFLLASLLWKSRAIPFFYSTYTSLPLHDEFFPGLMRSTGVLATAFVIPIALGIAVFFSASRRLLWVQSIATTICVFVLCTHQGTYNDATFVTCFWTSAWCLWYVSRFNDTTSDLLAKGQRIAVLIFSVIFLGGAFGKWTPGYWSGEVLYEIYFVDRNFWFHNLLRSTLDAEMLRSFATCYSRMVVLTETACAFLWLLPTRIASALAIAVFMGIAVFSNTNLFSVMFCLFGLALVGLHDSKRAIAQNPFQVQ